MDEPRRFRPRHGALLAATALLLALGACNFQAPPAAEHDHDGLSDHALAHLNPALLTLPTGPMPFELRDVAPLDVPTLIAPLAAATDQVRMALLVISATTDPGQDGAVLDAWTTVLDQMGVPHDVLVASDEELTVARLVDAAGVGRYQGILLTTGSLGYDTGGAFVSAFAADEWALLWEYARAFGVRQAALYAFPGDSPEDYGIGLAEAGTNAPDGYTITPTAAGAAVFDYLAAGAQVPIVNDVYVYRSELLPESTAQPLLVDGAGNVLAVSATAADGRERLVATFANAAYAQSGSDTNFQALLHTQLLAPGMVEWVTRGFHLGERRLHLDADVDDWFIPTGIWDTTTNDFSDTEQFVLSARDAWSFERQQDALRAAFPLATDFTWTMAFNGEGSDPGAALECDPDAAGVTLSAMTKCVAADFRWVNHTWSHAYMDRNLGVYDISYAQILAEIEQNDAIVDDFGFGSQFAPGSLVTGDISGLGWYSPDGPDGGLKVDNGLEASNPDLLAALIATGRRYLASNMSTPSHEPDCLHCGIVHPLNAGVFLVPRWPTNVFAPVTTPDMAVSAFNSIYGPTGVTPFFDTDLTYEEYLDFDTDVGLNHVLAGSPYPHYFHVANLYEYAPGRSLLTDWATRLLEKYTALVDLPIRSLDWDALGAQVEARTSFTGAGASAVWNRTTGSATVTAANGGTVFLTGAALPGGATTTYGGRTIAQRDFAPGETVVVAAAPTVDPPTEPTLTTLSVTIVGQGAVTGVAADYAFFETATITAVPDVDWRFVGWSVDLSGTTNPAALAMTANRSVTATFAAKTAQTIAFEPLPDLLPDAEPFVLTASASSGLPVSYAASGVCSLSSTTLTLSGDLGTCTVTASQAGDDVYLAAPNVLRSLTVSLVPRHALSVSVRGGGIGLVVSSPSGIECAGGTCRTTFDEGTDVTLVAIPVYGSTFTGWTGACGGTGACTVSIDDDRSVVATFAFAD
ncbi:MAG: hypothetical protein ABR510_05405 [Trueperaceae bacterium]